MGEIIILTGPVRSGKTTALKRWADSRNDVHGILTPDMHGKRVFIHYPDKIIIPMIAEKNDPQSIIIDKFSFSREGFNQVNKRLMSDVDNETKKYLIIDEIGILELDRMGLFPAFDYALEKINSLDKVLLLIIREKLLNRIKMQFRLHGISVIHKSELSNLG